MKKLFTILAVVLITASVFLPRQAGAQSPEKMSYQAVIRNSSDALVTNTQVGMQISILQGTTDGSPVYVETQTPTTNANGLVIVEIGDGTVLNGDFTAIDWANGPYFIKTETDPVGSTSYTITGTSQLLSVPYALHAKTAETVTESDPLFTSWDKTTGISITESQISDLGTYIETENDPIYTGSQAANITATDITNLGTLSGTNTGDQSLILSGQNLTISNGNTITLPAGGSSSLPVYTTTEIAALSPAQGDAVFNSTETLYQVYVNSAWQSFNANCWPQPTTADAGTDQTFTDGTVTTTLAANSPEAEHGTGAWTIISGTGGSFNDATNPTATFTGTECTAYTLQWTITTSCNSSSDNVNITFNQTPTTADAGTNHTFTDGTVTTTLAANSPEAEHGTGAWTIISGTGGSFDDAANPTTTFTGQLYQTYELQWSITTSCAISTDNVNVFFGQNGAGETINDVDGNTYNTVWIGTQQWMAENLKTTKYNDGTDIPLVTDGSEWGNLTTPGYCWYDNAQATYGDTYGALYNWYTVETGNLCPAGWHVPTDAEWTQLTDYLGGESVAGGKLKETGTTHWISPNEGATNESGFTALPGGYRFANGNFYSIGRYGYWWSATEYNTYYAWDRDMYYGDSNVNRYSSSKENGFSIRCLRD